MGAVKQPRVKPVRAGQALPAAPSPSAKVVATSRASGRERCVWERLLRRKRLSVRPRAVERAGQGRP